MRFNDAVFGIILIVFAIAMIAWTTTFPTLYGQNYGPDLFPIIIGAGFALCGVILTVRGMIERRTVPLVQMGEWAKDPRIVTNVALLIGSMILYILLSDLLGFIVTSFAILTILMIRLGTSVPVSLGLAVIVTLAIHSVFAKLLLVPLPWGILQPVAW